MKVNLFVTCLIDQFYPTVGEAVVEVLERLGVEVEFLHEQTCCAQPAFNDGFRDDARPVARRLLHLFPPDIPVIVPSGSCGTMIRRYYADLFPPDSSDAARLRQLQPMVFEFSEFIVDRLGVTDVGAAWSGKFAYHDSCHLLRELGVRQQPRKLLGAVRGLELLELRDRETCCGFGGLFSVKFPHISDAILRAKLDAVGATGADFVVANDMGCLMQIGGALSRQRSPIRALHLAQVLQRCS